MASSLPDTTAVVELVRSAGLEKVRVRWLSEVDRVERAHRSALERLVDPWRRYLLTGRAPIVIARNEWRSKQDGPPFEAEPRPET